MQTRRRGVDVVDCGAGGLATNGVERKYEPITSKAQFVREYVKGTFGNRAPTWDTLGEYLASGYRGLIHVRNRVANAETWYNVRPEDVVATWDLAQSKGYMPNQLYLSAMAPTDQTLIQGEVWRAVGGLEFTYSTVRKPMRDALAERLERVHGIIAHSLLRCHMNEYSYDWLLTLLDRYPDHVIELSVYGVEWGTVALHNAVFWEVRLY